MDELTKQLWLAIKENDLEKITIILQRIKTLAGENPDEQIQFH